MAKARKKTARSRTKAKTSAKRKSPARKASRAKTARKSKARKVARKSAPRRRRKQEGLIETVQESFKDSAKMQERAGTRWGTGEG